MPDPIRIGSEALASSGLDDTCTPAFFRAGSVGQKPDSQPEPNWIQAGFAQYDLGRLWKNATESESGKLEVGQKLSLMIPAHQIASRPDAFGQTLTRPSRSDPVLHNMIHAFFESETESNAGSWMKHFKYIYIYLIQPNSGCAPTIMAIT